MAITAGTMRLVDAYDKLKATCHASQAKSFAANITLNNRVCVKPLTGIAMTWYHLSPEDGLNCIVPSTSTSTRTPSSITPRKPDQSFGEDQETNRVCVAPTVWQCVLATPRRGLLHIYEIDVEFVTEPSGNICDIAWSHEKWITDDDLSRADNSVNMCRVGAIQITRDLQTSLQVARHSNDLPLAGDDQSSVWDTRNDLWLLKPDFCC